MIRVKGKKELCYCENYTKFFKSIQGIGNFNIFKKYSVIETIVENYVDKEYKDFLAQPIIEGNDIYWFCKTYNENPIPLAKLDGDDSSKYNQVKNDTISHYKNALEKLTTENKKEEAELLSKVLKYINDNFIYCFNNKVILGIWGMQLKDEVREPIGSAVKNLYTIKKKKNNLANSNNKENDSIAEEVSDEVPEINSVYSVKFNSGNKGEVNGNSYLEKKKNELIHSNEIPIVIPNEGFEFKGWNINPLNFSVNQDVEFTAQYNETSLVIRPLVLPWYVRFWNWLKNLFSGRGCLKWLLWLLIFLLLLFLLSLLFRGCNGNGFGGFGGFGGGGNGKNGSSGNAGGSDIVAPIPSPIDDKPWIDKDPNVGNGGKYNPGNPYDNNPTPPEFKDVLPPYQGILPPIDSSNIIRQPGNPIIIGNRLNVLMENTDKSIMELAKDFKEKYPSDEYSVVYYDDVVKRMQIQIPEKDRIRLKDELPSIFAPKYDLFVFDESLFESLYTPNDPAFKNDQKSWYLKSINAPQAWSITLGLPDVTIAIVDNGFNLKHPEISSKVVMPYNVWTHSSEVYAQSEDHGTHVAGTALAIMDNGKGLCGIAPKSAFMPVQVANQQGIMTITSVLDGVLYSLYQGADVVNVSLGLDLSGNLPENVQKDFQDNRFKEEERLWNHIMKISANHNSILVVSAGNDNILAGVNPMNRPKDFIVVSATDKDNRSYSKARFSNYGQYSTISAPGVDIYSTIGSNNYDFKSGTSMASPIVSGAVALLKSIDKNLTSEEIICILQSTGLPSEDEIGNIIQLDKALELVNSNDFDDCNTKLEHKKPSSGDVQILLSWDNYNDLDLACVDPFGNTVWFKNKSVPSGGLLEIDMNVFPNSSKSPIENIFWPENEAPNGKYEVYLWKYKQHEAQINETAYKINVLYGDSSKEYNGVIKKEDGRMFVGSFILGDDIAREPYIESPDKTNDDIEKLKKEREQLQKKLDEIDRQLNKIQ